MNNEIKEILELLKEDLYIPQEDNREYKLLDKGDDKLLLDYITNLQKYYNDNVNKYEELIVKYSNLQERIEKAIEYIKEQDMSYYGAVVNTKMEIILNILGGKNE